MIITSNLSRVIVIPSVYFIHCTAPPKLLNVVECDYEENRCKKAMTTFVQNRPFNMSVEFIGNGPFKVTWTFNGEPYLCSEHKLCQIITKTNRQVCVCVFMPVFSIYVWVLTDNDNKCVHLFVRIHFCSVHFCLLKLLYRCISSPLMH